MHAYGRGDEAVHLVYGVLFLLFVCFKLIFPSFFYKMLSEAGSSMIMHVYAKSFPSENAHVPYLTLATKKRLRLHMCFSIQYSFLSSFCFFFFPFLDFFFCSLKKSMKSAKMPWIEYYISPEESSVLHNSPVPLDRKRKKML